jgi:UDP-glucose 4-epimerase
VKDVISAVERVSGRPVPWTPAGRREGDPGVLFASSARIRAELGWRPAFTTLDRIVETAWRWKLAHPYGFNERTAG